MKIPKKIAFGDMSLPEQSLPRTLEIRATTAAEQRTSYCNTSALIPEKNYCIIRLFRLSDCALIRLFRALTLIRLVSYPLNFNFLFSRYPLIFLPKSRYPLNPGDPPPPLGGGVH